ncbi:hypothetical protein [Brevundimonas sp.]|uniref:hypothetical protein n=1 Tax=Brevundimonas sp. TaxID=1871086 RepID=UPI00289DC442|nr:hypothetical protein [Brevundimonas sp.]
MAGDINTLVLQMNADISKMSKQLDRAQGKFDSTANAIERRQRQLDKNLANLGRDAANFARPVQIASTVALGAITAMSYNAAKRAEAVSGAFEQTFRDMPAEASRSTAAISEQFGRLETDIKDNFTQLRSVVSALGVDAQTSLGIVDQLQRRSLDMAAFKDVSDAEAFRAVLSGITGETEPLKRFGVVLNETAVSAELLRLGFKGKAKDASEAAKVIARTNIILRQTGEMQGQVAREADTLSEKEKRVRAEFTKAAEDFGSQFLPVAAKVLTWTTDALKAFNDLPSGVQMAGLAMLALVAAGGPIMSVIKGLQAIIKAAIAARAAMAVVGGSAGAGLAGGAAAGVTAGTLARVAPVAAGAAAIGAGTASFAPAPVRDEAMVQRDLALERQNVQRLKDEGASANRVANAERRVTARLVELSQVQKKAAAEYAKAENEVQAAVEAATNGLGDFGLTPDLQTGGGSGGGTGSGRGAAAAEARKKEAREQLSLQLATDIARASGDEAAIKAAERKQELARLTAQYESAGYTDAAQKAQSHLDYLNQAEDAAEAREKAEKEIDAILDGRRRQLEREAEYERLLNDQLLDRLGYEAELARLSGNEGRLKNAERELWIEQRINELLRLRPELNRDGAREVAGKEYDSLEKAEDQGRMREEFRSAFRDGIKAAIDGDLGGFFADLADRFTDRMLNNLADNLFNIFENALNGMDFSSMMSHGEGNEWWRMALNAVTGKRALGGPVVRGQPYLVGERGPEVFMPGSTGGIIPKVAAISQQASGISRTVVQHLNFDLSGAVMTEDLLMQMDQKANAARLGAVAQVASSAAEQQRRARYQIRGGQ